MKIRSIGIDLGKTAFHLVALGERGNGTRGTHRVPGDSISIKAGYICAD
jgi:hypothetical protein